MKIETVHTSEFEMDFFRFGNPENPKIVVIPGLSLKSVMLSADNIETAYKKLSDNFEVYFIDRRKKIPLNSKISENSDETVSGYSIYEMAKDTAEVLKKLNLNDINLLGVSQGGMISQYIAINNPELVKRLLLVSTACKVEEKNRRLFETWESLSKNKASRKLAESFGTSVYSPGFYEKYKDNIFSACNCTDEEFEKFSIMVKSLYNLDLQQELYKIKCPAMVFAGQNDKIFSVEQSKAMAEKIGCPLYVFKDFGHALYDESPEYIEKMLEFFQK